MKSLNVLFFLLFLGLQFTVTAQSHPNSPKEKSNKILAKEIKTILNVLDNNKASVSEQLKVYADDVVHMAPNHEAIIGKANLGNYLAEQRKYGYSDMEHQIIEINDLGEGIIMRGQVIGRFHPASDSPPMQFRTKNMFVFKRIEGKLKIWKIIYNMAPKS